jgi:hypothetical protein
MRHEEQALILSFRQCARSTLIALATIGFSGGCGPTTMPAPPAPADGSLGEAGPNRRLGFKPEYKQMIGKNGELLKKRPAASKH